MLFKVCYNIFRWDVWKSESFVYSKETLKLKHSGQKSILEEKPTLYLQTTNDQMSKWEIEQFRACQIKINFVDIH